MGDGDDAIAYASAELGDFVRGDVDLRKSNSGMLREHAAAVAPEDVDFISYLDGLLEEDDRVDGGLQGSALGDLVLRGRATKTATKAAAEGNVSQIKALTGLTSAKGEGGEAITEAAGRLEDEGAIGLCFGPPGAGKTAFVMDVAVTWRALTGGRIVTNIEGWGAADHHATSSAEVLRYMASTQGQVLAVLDEVREALKSDNRKQAEQFAEALRLIRKKGENDRFAKKGSAFMVAHTQNGTAPSIRRLASFGTRKPKRTDPGRVELLDSVGGVDEWSVEREFSGVTDTAEDFETHEASDFRVVLEEEREAADPEEAAQQASEAAQVRAGVMAYLRGMSQGEAATLTDYSRGWVGDRWREWADGEHRDVLPLEDAPLPDDPVDEDLPGTTTVDEVAGL